MENRGSGPRMDNPAEKAEYDELVRRFLEEEEKNYRDSLLMRGEQFIRPKSGN